MKNRSLIAALIIIGFFSIQYKRAIKEAPLAFRCPEIIHHDISKGFHHLLPRFMPRSQPVFIGKYTFRDSLELPADLGAVRDMTSTDVIFSYEARYRRLYLPMDGLQLIPDPDATVIFNTSRYHPEYEQQSLLFYPVYVVNETEGVKYLHLFNDEPLAIQEAKESLQSSSSSTWRPIEKRKAMGCTAAERYVRINPGEFVMFIMPKYDGYVFTDIRVRLRNGANTIVSKPFPGYVQQQQFIEDPEDDFIEGEPYSPSDLDWYFFGAVPLEVDVVWERS